MWSKLSAPENRRQEPLLKRSAFRQECGVEPGATLSSGLAAPWLLTGIVCLGLALRLYRLSSQSVWMDEFNVMTGLPDPTLAGYFATFRFYAPDNMPLAWLIRYGCAQIIGPSWLVGTRLEQVALGTACIPMVYLLGKSAFGRGAGLLAALCLALSPVHLWTAQDLRPNVLIEFLAVVSILSFAKGLRSDRFGWWVLNIIANLCLVWTHLFLVLLVATECCVMAVCIRSRFKRTVVWGTAQCLVCLTPLLWLGVHFSSVSDVNEDFYRNVPGVHDLVTDLVEDDAVRVSDPFAFQGETWHFLPPHVQQVFDAWHGVFDTALALFFAACFLWGLVGLYRAWRQSRNPAACSDRPELFLLIVWFLPPALLLLGSWAFRPMMMPRYTGYCSFALYVLAGGAIAACRQDWIRRTLTIVLVLLYGYQLSLALPASTRTDWRSAITLIRAQASPGDIVLAKGNMGTRMIYLYNAKLLPPHEVTDDPVVVPAPTLQSVVEKSERALSTPSPPHAVWALMERFVFSMPPLADFETCLTSRGLAYTRTDFPGMNGIQVYRITRDPHPAATKTSCRVEGTFADYPGLLADLGFTKADGPEYDKALESLHRAVDSEWPRSKLYFAFLGLILSDEHQGSLAATAARCSVRLDPHYAFGQFAVAVAEYEDGRPDAGDEAFAQAVACDTTGNYIRYGPLLEALYHPGTNPPQAAGHALSLLKELDSKGVFLPFVFYLRSGALPQSVAALN
jgi:4-amino-4-deoxy-L-arabinose transferase-like glycosyltransferase